jgi:hypothetical protein
LTDSIESNPHQLDTQLRKRQVLSSLLALKFLKESHPATWSRMWVDLASIWEKKNEKEVILTSRALPSFKKLKK